MIAWEHVEHGSFCESDGIYDKPDPHFNYGYAPEGLHNDGGNLTRYKTEHSAFTRVEINCVAEYGLGMDSSPGSNFLR